MNGETVMDLHSHTYYSHCGRDDPHAVVEAALRGGVSVLGISDHNYGIGERKAQYLAEMRALAEEYKGRIQILCGIEIATHAHLYDLQSADEIKGYDYCLIEHITAEDSIVGGDLFAFCAKLNIPCGIAHTDLFAYCDQRGLAYKEFFEGMARAGIFWEMNVNYDSIHGYREHAYIKELFGERERLGIVRDAGVRISVGFDGHRCEEYDGARVQSMNRLLKENGLNTVEGWLF